MKYESKETIRSDGKVHNVGLKLKNEYGSTSCGIRIVPKNVVKKGIVNCRYCKRHMDGRWLRKMAKLEEGCDVTAGGSLQ